MGRGCAVVLLTLLVLSSGARGEEVAQPVPADGQCTVAADKDWTPQEKFVWGRVCIGKEANFNEGSDYGGDLYPKRPEGLPESRVLRSTFLETILLKDKYRRGLTRRGVRIVGARFTETIDLENAELGHELWLDRSLLEQGAKLSGLRSTQRITFDGSKVTGTLDMHGLHVDEDVSMSDGSDIAEVDLGHAHVGGTLELIGSKVTGKLNMNGLRVDQALFMRGGAEFAEVDLGHAHVGGTLELIGSKFAEADLNGAHVGGGLDMSGSKVTGTLNMNGLWVDRHLFMRDGSEYADVDLTGAHVGATLDLIGSKVTGTLDMNSLRVDQSLFMRGGAEFAKVNLVGARVGGTLELIGSKFAEVDLKGAHVGGDLDMSGSKVNRTLDMNGLQVGESLFMRGKAEFAEVDLGSAHVGGQLDLSSSKVAGKLNMNGLRVGESLFMRDKAEFAEVDMAGAHVGATLDLSGSKVTGKLNMNGLHVGEHLFMRDKAEFAAVDLVGAYVGRDLDVSGAKVTGELDMGALQVGGDLFMHATLDFKTEFADVNLTGARVRGQLALIGSTVAGNLTGDTIDVGETVFLGRGAEFMKPVHLSFGKIGEILELAGGVFHNNVDLTATQIAGELHLGSSNSWAHWPTGENSTLILRNAKVDAIQDLSDAWPARLDLNGFTYRSLGGINAAELDPMAERSVEWFQGWLRKQEHYTPQPYEQLATVLRAQGQPDKADDILYTGRERERADTLTSDFLRWMWLTALDLLIGYGYHIERSVYWVLGLWVAGVIVLFATGEGRRNKMPFGLSYSLDMLLPIIRLEEEHYRITLHGFSRYYFYGHKIMGYVLAAFLAAGLSGLTK